MMLDKEKCYSGERIEASAKDGEGAGRGPCGLRNSELGPRPHY